MYIMGQYFGCDDPADFAYFAECGLGFDYRGHGYDLFHNGLGFCIEPADEDRIYQFESVDDMLDKFRFWDGRLMRDAYENGYDRDA